MHFSTSTLALALVSAVAAQSIRGFNTGSRTLAGASKVQADFQAEFKNQQNIDGLDGSFTSARLYTMIQDGTTNTPISAIPAAMAAGSRTKLLLGLWASVNQAGFDNEIAALGNAITQYGKDFTDLVVGISVGSEDLYRITPTGIENGSGAGQTADILIDYIGQVRKTIQGTSLSGAKVGHVDTWNAWINTTLAGSVADACDWVGIDEYPYYQSTDPNPISNAQNLFYAAYDRTQQATGKPVWVTEAGWPTTGPKVGQAVASVDNARTFWLDVYCTLPAGTPVFWYTQIDANPNNVEKFSLVGPSLDTTPLYDLSCADAKPLALSSSTSAQPSSTAGSSAARSSAAATSAAATSAAATSAAAASTSSTSSVSVIPLPSFTDDLSVSSTAAVLPTVRSSSSVPFPSSSTSLYVSSSSSSSSSSSAASSTRASTSSSSSARTTASSGARSSLAASLVPTISTSRAGTSTAAATSPTGTPFDPNTGNNLQVGILSLLVVPAVFAFMA